MFNNSIHDERPQAEMVKGSETSTQKPENSDKTDKPKRKRQHLSQKEKDIKYPQFIALLNRSCSKGTILRVLNLVPSMYDELSGIATEKQASFECAGQQAVFHRTEMPQAVQRKLSASAELLEFTFEPNGSGIFQPISADALLAEISSRADQM